MSDKAEWHVLTISRGGTVSLLKNLTEEAARRACQSIVCAMPFSRGDPWSDTAIRRQISGEMWGKLRPGEGYSYGGFHSSRDGDIEKLDVWGPEGSTLEIWPKPDDYEEREARHRAEAASFDDGEWKALFDRTRNPEWSWPARRTEPAA